MTKLLSIPLEDITPSPLNPRRSIPKEQLAELVTSIRAHGVLQPVVVRTGKNGTKYELVAGHRRLAAAKLAEIDALPATQRDLSDTEVLEIQLIENLQRSDLHPLEEAQGYHQLMRIAKYDAAHVAASIGRSVKYVYDRVKLLQLTKEAKALFLGDKITAGHAILLARLSAKDQAKAISIGDRGVGGLFQAEMVQLNLDADVDEPEPIKARSVRELAAWIDDHVKFDTREPDPMLFPETALAIERAVEAKAKIIPITHEHYVQPEARDKERIYGPWSWKRADGKAVEDERTGKPVNSKTCDRSGMGVIVVGEDRGDAFLVCVSRACPIHWPEKKKSKLAAASGGNAQENANSAARAREESNRREEEKRKRWIKARPAIFAAIGEKVKAAAAGSQGALAEILIRECRGYNQVKSDAVPRGRTAEDLVRHLAFLVVCNEASGEWNVASNLPGLAKRFGVDAGKILNQVAPVQTSAATKPSVSGSGKSRSKKGKRRV